MFDYIWPAVVVVVSNVLYHVVAKLMPQDADPFLSLTATYLAAAFMSFALYFALRGDGALKTDAAHLSWSTLLFGLSIIGLEAGYIYFYRAGWRISTGSIVTNISVALFLALIGVMGFKETIGVKKLAGIALCVAGLVLINFPGA